MKIAEIKNLKEENGGGTVNFIAVLKSLKLRTAKNSSEFLMLEFGDNSGALPAMCFDGGSAFFALRDAQIGGAFEISAAIDFYQGRLSPKIESARALSPEETEAHCAELAAVSPCDPEEMRAELETFIDSIKSGPLRNTVKFAIDETGGAFYKSTAAVKMHHAYMFGLLEHSLRCARMANALAPLYPAIDRDLALAGAIIHDVGKVIEYSQGLAPDRTRLGILQGHVVLGYRIVRRAGLKNGLDADTLERLEHIVLSHQGEPEWGAAVKAATPEAVFVSTIDNFDAKMGAVEAAIAQSSGSEFVEVPALGVKVLAAKPSKKNEE